MGAMSGELSGTAQELEEWVQEQTLTRMLSAAARTEDVFDEFDSEFEAEELFVENTGESHGCTPAVRAAHRCDEVWRACRADDAKRMSSAAGLPRPLRRRASLVTTALDRLPVEMAKKALLETLTATGGEPKDERVVAAARRLGEEWRAMRHSASLAVKRGVAASAEPLNEGVQLASGRWVARTRASFPGSLGQCCETGAYKYSLGRMSFGLFAPHDVVVSVDECFITVRPLGVFDRPRVVPEAIANRKLARSYVRTYDIDARVTVHDDRARGLRGRMVTHGYCVDSDTQAAQDSAHRLDVWFVNGELCEMPEDVADLEARKTWARLFGPEADDSRKHASLVSRAVLWLASLALGIEQTPGLEQRYFFNKPMAGHVDVIFADDSLRVTRGNRNSLVVLERCGDS